MKTVCQFKLAKVTPGALQYKQVSQDDLPVDQGSDSKLIGTLYLRKAQVEGQPETVTVTVEA